MKLLAAALVALLAVAVHLSSAERQYQAGSRGPSMDEVHYGLFRDLGPESTIVNLRGEDARSDYRLSKMTERRDAKSDVNQLRRRRRAVPPGGFVSRVDDVK